MTPVSYKSYRNVQVSVFVAQDQNDKWYAEVKYDGLVAKSRADGDNTDTESEALADAMWELSNQLDARGLEQRTMKLADPVTE